MSTPGWTPGPWQTRPRPEGYFYIEQTTGRIIVAVTVGGLGEEEKINANLLAAAPELYEALAEVLDEHDRSVAVPFKARLEMWDSARSALAKARGESQ